jgi:hypothetical protein
MSADEPEMQLLTVINLDAHHGAYTWRTTFGQPTVPELHRVLHICTHRGHTLSHIFADRHGITLGILASHSDWIRDFPSSDPGPESSQNDQ